MHASYDTQPHPSGDNTRAIIHASYDTKPPPRGNDILALMHASYDTKPPRRANNIRAMIHASSDILIVGTWSSFRDQPLPTVNSQTSEEQFGRYLERERVAIFGRRSEKSQKEKRVARHNFYREIYVG